MHIMVISNKENEWIPSQFKMERQKWYQNTMIPVSKYRTANFDILRC